MTRRESDYDQFENLTIAIVRAPHSEIKAKLDAEKRAKGRNKSKTSSVSAWQAIRISQASYPLYQSIQRK
jgi:hypothetical protein